MKKTKENVYVVIDTPKKAKKVKKVLDMFGENIERYTNQTLSDYNQPWTAFYSKKDGFIGEHDRSIKDRERVSIKELRNILAIENLKEGDVVVCHNKKADTHIFEIEKKFCNSVTYEKRYSLLDRKTEEYIGSWDLDYFLRYATEEEKALLEDKPIELTKEEVEKKVVEYAVSVDWEYESLHNYIGNRISQEEYNTLDGKYTDDKVKVIIKKFKPKLEVGKWYTFAWSDKPNDVRGIYFIEKVEDIKVWFSYGIDFTENEWQSKDWYNTCHVYKEATKEEVEQALIKEAKKRYKVGDNIKCLSGDYARKIGGINPNILYTHEYRDIWYGGVKIYDNGKWAEIVKPSFVESSPLTVTIETKDISVIEQLHDLLLDAHGYSLEYKLLRDARELAQKLTKLI